METRPGAEPTAKSARPEIISATIFESVSKLLTVMSSMLMPALSSAMVMKPRMPPSFSVARVLPRNCSAVALIAAVGSMPSSMNAVTDL